MVCAVQGGRRPGTSSVCRTNRSSHNVSWSVGAEKPAHTEHPPRKTAAMLPQQEVLIGANSLTLPPPVPYRHLPSLLACMQGTNDSGPRASCQVAYWLWMVRSRLRPPQNRSATAVSRPSPFPAHTLAPAHVCPHVCQERLVHLPRLWTAATSMMEQPYCWLPPLQRHA
jgi:hypothetical protein